MQLSGAMQPRDEPASVGNFQPGQQPLQPAFPEPNAETVRMVEETPGPAAAVPSWDASGWAVPSPPPAPPAMPSQGSSSTNPPPSHGGVAREFVSVGPPASSSSYNGSFQKLPTAPYSWTPLNTLMHSSPKLFDSSLGRGRLPVMSHNVNGASGIPAGLPAGMPAADVVDDATVSSSGVPLNQFSSSVQQGGWPPPPPGSTPINVVNHHNVVTNSPPPPAWSHSDPADFTSHHRLPEPPLWGRPPQLPSSSLSTPLPPYPQPHPQPHAPPHSRPQYWQLQDSFRPSPPPFRQDCRPHHPSAPWHNPNYGHNPR